MSRRFLKLYPLSIYHLWNFPGRKSSAGGLIAAERTGRDDAAARPGGNITGLSLQQADLAGKRLELLREVIPALRRLAILANVSNLNAVPETGEVRAAARTLGLEVAVFEIRRADDIAPAFEALMKGRLEALYIIGDPLLTANRIRINTLALGARLPTSYANRESVEVGGLMSYGPNFPDLFRRAAEYVDKILRGAKPADLPVERPTKFDLVVNLARSRGLPEGTVGWLQHRRRSRP